MKTIKESIVSSVGAGKEKIINQIKNIDFDQTIELFNITKKSIKKPDGEVTNIEYVDKSRLSKEDYNKYYEIGEKIVQDGKYAVVTMAGGQGTRLGHPGPKGTFKLDVYGKGKYLFEILTENLFSISFMFSSKFPNTFIIKSLSAISINLSIIAFVLFYFFFYSPVI